MLLQFNTSGRSHDDYVATYDPKNSRITRLKMPRLPQGLSVHGMDVVPSAANSKDLFVYLVNHQPPLSEDPMKFGANSTIEIFKTRVGASTLMHFHTIHSPVLITPNDIVGSSDGKSFYFTNTAGAKTGHVSIRWLAETFYPMILKQMKFVNTLLRRPVASVGYCHVNEGCKFAASKIHQANGIASVNDTFYVANTMEGTVTVLERQNDNSLVLMDVIPTGALSFCQHFHSAVNSFDKITKTKYWTICLSTKMGWCGLLVSRYSYHNIGCADISSGIPDLFKFLTHIRNPSVSAPSTALRVSLNMGKGAFYGHKYKVEKVY
jgi:hypothetical protein